MTKKHGYFTAVCFLCLLMLTACRNTGKTVYLDVVVKDLRDGYLVAGKAENGIALPGTEMILQTESVLEDVQPGDVLTVAYDGQISDSCPAQLLQVYGAAKKQNEEALRSFLEMKTDKTALPEKILVFQDACVEYEISDFDETKAQIQVTIRNNSTETIKNWGLLYASQAEIKEIENARIIAQGGIHYLCGMAENPSIPPEGEVSFSMKVVRNGEEKAPFRYRLYCTADSAKAPDLGRYRQVQDQLDYDESEQQYTLKLQGETIALTDSLITVKEVVFLNDIPEIFRNDEVSQTNQLFHYGYHWEKEPEDTLYAFAVEYEWFDHGDSVYPKDFPVQYFDESAEMYQERCLRYLSIKAAELMEQEGLMVLAEYPSSYYLQETLIQSSREERQDLYANGYCVVAATRAKLERVLDETEPLEGNWCVTAWPACRPDMMDLLTEYGWTSYEETGNYLSDWYRHNKERMTEAMGDGETVTLEVPVFEKPGAWVIQAYTEEYNRPYDAQTSGKKTEYEKVHVYEAGHHTIPAELYTGDTTLDQACGRFLPEWRGFSINFENRKAEENDYGGPAETYSYYEDSVYEAQIRYIKELGGNFLRAYVSWNWLQMPESNQDSCFNARRLERLDHLLACCMENDIHLQLAFVDIPNIETYGLQGETWDKEIGKLFDDELVVEKTRECWEMLARRYNDIPNEYLSFQLLADYIVQETVIEYADSRYVDALMPIVQAIRKETPGRTILVDSYGKELSGDGFVSDDVALTYHMSPNTDPENTDSHIDLQELNQVLQIGRYPHTDIMVGEFGVFSLEGEEKNPDAMNKAREYLTEEIRLMEENVLPWCYELVGDASPLTKEPVYEGTAYERLEETPFYRNLEMEEYWHEKLGGAGI